MRDQKQCGQIDCRLQRKYFNENYFRKRFDYGRRFGERYDLRQLVTPGQWWQHLQGRILIKKG